MKLFYILIAIIPIVSLIVMGILSYKQVKRGKSPKKVLATQALLFLMVSVLVVGFSVSVSANDKTDTQQPQVTQEQTQTTKHDLTLSEGIGLLAAALVTGLAGIGGGIAVAAGAPAAIAATSEDAKAFGKALIFVALGESIALYGVVISILILNKF